MYGPKLHCQIVFLAHRLVGVVIDDADFAALMAIARSGDLMIAGSSTRTVMARRAADLGRRGLARYVSGAEGGWSVGLWAAYPTCNGFNAMWRHAGDTHVDGCGSVWNADGSCSGCREVRRLDLLACEQYIQTLPAEARDVELRTAALWCAEHGFIRQPDVTTGKTCRFPGSPVHDGGLDRVSHSAFALSLRGSGAGELKGRAGLASHASPQEQARSVAFVAQIEGGTG